MVVMDQSVISSPQRLGAMRRAQLVLPCMHLSVERITEFAARSVSAPICQITFVGQFDYHLAGGYGLWPDLAADGHAPLAYSVCKYVVSAGHPVSSEDMLADDDSRIREHPLAVEYGARAFLGVPLRDATEEPVGAITVLDTAARPWTAAQLLKIVDVADLIGPVSTDLNGTPLPITALDSAGILHGMQEAFVAINGDAVVVGYNSAAQELFGWPTDQVCGRPIEETLFPDYQDQIMRELLTQMRFAPSQLRMRQQLLLRHEDGHLLTVPASLSMVHGSVGSLLCAFIVRSDARPA